MTDIAKTLGIVMLPYKWRGKTYKTVSGLCAAVYKQHPGCRVSFDRDFMYVRLAIIGGVSQRYEVERKPDVSIVADKAVAS